MFNLHNNNSTTFDITETGHIERIVVGTTDPSQMPSEEETQGKIEILNRCLSEHPKGKIIGIERSFSIIRIGEHQVVLEAVIYHIGFKKAPLWLTESKKRKPEFSIDNQKVENIINSL